MSLNQPDAPGGPFRVLLMGALSVNGKDMEARRAPVLVAALLSLPSSLGIVTVALDSLRSTHSVILALIAVPSFASVLCGLAAAAYGVYVTATRRVIWRGWGKRSAVVLWAVVGWCWLAGVVSIKYWESTFAW
jgi:hypothetical protein